MSLHLAKRKVRYRIMVASQQEQLLFTMQEIDLQSAGLKGNSSTKWYTLLIFVSPVSILKLLFQQKNYIERMKQLSSKILKPYVVCDDPTGVHQRLHTAIQYIVFRQYYLQNPYDPCSLPNSQTPLIRLFLLWVLQRSYNLVGYLVNGLEQHT